MLSKHFRSLNNSFAMFLSLPDHKQQFIMEVDMSDAGVGAVLSQHSTVDKKIHPCVGTHG